MDYKTKMKKDKQKIKKVKIKLRKAVFEYKKTRRKQIKRAIKNFMKDWKENLNPAKMFKFKIWSARRKEQQQIHEYVKLCGKSKW